MWLFKKCEYCKRLDWRWQIKKRDVVLPIGQVAKSQKSICPKCQKIIQKAISINTIKVG